VHACGDGVVDTPEECDGTADAACPGRCQPDCTCAAPSDSGCGAAVAPECDGACPEGEACALLGPDACTCIQVPVPCGLLAGAPLCQGACPASAPICRDVGAVCQCAAF
jgi:hypothetical protein